MGGALLNNVGDISIAYLFLGLRTCLGLENFALVRELCPGLSISDDDRAVGLRQSFLKILHPWILRFHVKSA